MTLIGRCGLVCDLPQLQVWVLEHKALTLTRAEPSCTILIPVYCEVLLEGLGWTWVMLCPERVNKSTPTLCLLVWTIPTLATWWHTVPLNSCQTLLSEFSRSGPVSLMVQHVTAENLIPLKHFHSTFSLHARIFYVIYIFIEYVYCVAVCIFHMCFKFVQVKDVHK